MLLDKRQQFSINAHLIQPHTHHCPDLCPGFSSISDANPGLIMCLAFPNTQPTSAHSLLNHQARETDSSRPKQVKDFSERRTVDGYSLQYRTSMRPLVFEWHRQKNTRADVLWS